MPLVIAEDDLLKFYSKTADQMAAKLISSSDENQVG
jgi:hypothetical protein